MQKETGIGSIQDLSRASLYLLCRRSISVGASIASEAMGRLSRDQAWMTTLTGQNFASTEITTDTYIKRRLKILGICDFQFFNFLSFHLQQTPPKNET